MMDIHVKNLVESIQRKLELVSIFLYGARARTDFLKNSDYEIGGFVCSNQENNQARFGIC